MSPLSSPAGSPLFGNPSFSFSSSTFSLPPSFPPPTGRLLPPKLVTPQKSEEPRYDVAVPLLSVPPLTRATTEPRYDIAEEQPIAAAPLQNIPYKTIYQYVETSWNVTVGPTIGESRSSKVFRLIGSQQQDPLALKWTKDANSCACTGTFNPFVGAHLALNLRHPYLLTPTACLYFKNGKFSTNPRDFVRPQLAGQVMTALSGKNLRDLIKSGSITLLDGIGYLIKIADALVYLHAQRLIHSDISARNILIEGDQAYLCDFDLLQKLQSDEGSLYPNGNLLISSPERRVGHLHTQKTDCWSFGLVLYQLLHNRHAFTDLSLCGISQLAIGPKVPSGLRDLLADLIQPDPALRITMREARAQLIEIHEELSGPA